MHQRVRRDAHLLAVLLHFSLEIGRHLYDDPRDDARTRRGFLVDAVVLRDVVRHSDASEDGVARHLEGDSMLQDPEGDHPPDRPPERLMPFASRTLMARFLTPASTSRLMFAVLAVIAFILSRFGLAALASSMWSRERNRFRKWIRLQRRTADRGHCWDFD